MNKTYVAIAIVFFALMGKAHAADGELTIESIILQDMGLEQTIVNEADE